jgi:P-type E1-E2 ATPase
MKIKDVVVGDVIEVSAGNRVPADCVLFEEMNIKVDESSLHDRKTLARNNGTVVV